MRCLGKTQIPRRDDADGTEYEATADDADCAIMVLEDAAVAQINSSWAVRVNRDDPVEIPVAGTEGSTVAGLHDWRTQHRATTPKPVWDPDTPTDRDFTDDCEPVPDTRPFENPFEHGWRAFRSHVVADELVSWDFRARARGGQVTEASRRSWADGRKVTIDEVDS